MLATKQKTNKRTVRKVTTENKKILCLGKRSGEAAKGEKIQVRNFLFSEEIRNKLSNPNGKNLLCSFLDLSLNESGRATFYNTKEEIERSSEAVHEKLFGLDKDLYGLCLCLPGIQDQTKIRGLGKILKSESGNPLLFGTIVPKIIESLPSQRKAKLLKELAEKGKENKEGNGRIRKLILRTI